MDARRVSAIRQADRLLGRHQHLELVRRQHIDRVRAAQVITFQVIIVSVNKEIEQQRRHRSDARPFADAHQGGLDILCAVTHRLHRIHRRHAAVVVKVTFERRVRVALAHRLNTLRHVGGRRHADCVGHPQAVYPIHQRIVYAKQIVQPGARCFERLKILRFVHADIWRKGLDELDSVQNQRAQ
jgi:hypothetical protein